MCKIRTFLCLELVFLVNFVSRGSAENFNVYYESQGSSYKTLLNITDVVNTITIKNIDPYDGFGFLTIGVHTLLENVTLSYLNSVTYQYHVTGTNTGLYWDQSLGNLYQSNDSKVDKKTQYTKSTASFNDPVFYLFRNSTIKFDHVLQVYLVISFYNKSAPIPGGCNLSFESMIAPYQKVFYDENLITVTSQPSSCKDDTLCNKDLVEIDLYHMYFTLTNGEQSYYFKALSQMSTVKDIKTYGRKVPSLERARYQRKFSSYKGVGEVFAIVATYNGESSAYISTVSFGCNVEKWFEDCVGLKSDLWTMATSLLFLFLGGFLVFGHRFFNFSMFMVGFVFSNIVVYVTLLLGQNSFHLDKTYVFELILFGISAFFGLCWLGIWLIFQSPLTNTHLTYFLANVLIVSTVFYTGVADYSVIFTNDFAFWLSYSCMLLSILLVWTTLPLHTSHMLTLSLVGSYLIILSISYLIGGNLQYILINMKRRIAVDDFGWAVVSPPFETLDLVQVILFVIITLSGFLLQWWMQKGKPPFPLRTQEERNIQVNERTPLLADITTDSGTAPPAYTT